MEFREEGAGSTRAAQTRPQATLLLDWVVLTGAPLSYGNPADSALEICALFRVFLQ